MAKAGKNYGNESISLLEGAERVRKRPGVIFGSDGLDGCEHAVFEILSNSIDEAREGHGKVITLTHYADGSIEVEDNGRGCPVDWNPKEKRYNWELVYCELYAGGKYNNLDGDNYEYSLGLNGLGACATQYSSRYMDVTVWRDGNKYSLHFERGQITGKKGEELKIEPTDRGRKTGTRTRWLPDLDVFTDIDIPADYYVETLRRQAVVNAGITFRFRDQVGGKFETQEFLYENGIVDYVTELAGEGALTTPVFWETERRGRDRELDQAEDLHGMVAQLFILSTDQVAANRRRHREKHEKQQHHIVFPLFHITPAESFASSVIIGSENRPHSTMAAARTANGSFMRRPGSQFTTFSMPSSGRKYIDSAGPIR